MLDVFRKCHRQKIDILQNVNIAAAISCNVGAQLW